MGIPRIATLAAVGLMFGLACNAVAGESTAVTPLSTPPFPRNCVYPHPSVGPARKPSAPEMQRIVARHFAWLARSGNPFRAADERTDGSFPRLAPPYSLVANTQRGRPQQANLCGADLSGARLSRANLSHAFLNGADLRNADLSGAYLIETMVGSAHLSGANLSDAHIRNIYLAFSDLRGEETDLRDADMRGMIAENAFFNGADLVDAKLNGADFSGAHLEGAHLVGADLSDAQFFGTDLSGADFRAANLSRASFTDAHFPSARFDGANLSGASLAHADLRQTALIRGVNFSGANLAGADLRDEDLIDANFSGADLTSARLSAADLTRANLGGANLTGADLSGAILDGANVAKAQLAHTDVTNARYAPASESPDRYVADIKGLATLQAAPGQEIGLVQLRKLLADGGLRDAEREVTYAIERNVTAGRFERPFWSFAWVEGLGRFVGFDVTTAYGLHPAHALGWIIVLGLVLTPVYVRAILHPSPANGIVQVFPKDRLDGTAGDPGKEQERTKSVVQAADWRGALRCGAYFSLTSAVNIGFDQFNPGDWIRRLQPREYTLEAVGWVRVVAGAQALLSVYLLALWVLTQFGRPFG